MKFLLLLAIFCSPRQYEEPKTFEELRAKIQEASASAYHVRAIGNGYSITDIGCTDGCLLSLKNLNHILSVDTHTVRVEAGISLQKLNEELAERGLALPNQPAITEISLGGLLSTGVHGTGHTGSLSSFVREIELITADGTLHKFSKESDAFNAATVSLGSLGVIYAVTLQCEPLFTVSFSSEVHDIDYVLKNYEALHASNDFFQFFWNPETGKVTTNRWNRQEQAQPSYRALPFYVIDPNDKDLFSEIAIPVKVLPEALTTLQPICEKYRQLGAKIVDINVRFVDREESYLSPASDGPVAYLALCVLEEDKYIKFYEECENSLIVYGGRPHWGKCNFMNQEKARILYGTNLEKYLAVKRRLDPQGTFSNSFTDRVLGTN